MNDARRQDAPRVNMMSTWNGVSSIWVTYDQAYQAPCDTKESSFNEASHSTLTKFHAN